LKYIKDEYYRKLLLTEINIIKNLNHENIIKYFGILMLNNNEYQNDDTSFYIVTEYAKFGTLFDILHQKSSKLKKKFSKKLTLYEKFYILLKIANGMVYLHSRSPPVIHRDLKTENILLGKKNY
jgi:serine/threonine protein kinase